MCTVRGEHACTIKANARRGPGDEDHLRGLVRYVVDSPDHVANRFSSLSVEVSFDFLF